MAKLDTYVELLTSTLGALSDTSTGAASFSIVSSALEVNTGSGSDLGRGGVELAYGGDIDESSAYFEVTAIPTGGRCDIVVDDVSENGYRIRLDATNITVTRLVGGSPTTLAGPTAWSSASHKWLRFREASGTFFIEGAPDSGSGSPGTFSTLASEATTTSGMDHTAVRLFWFAPAGAGTGTSRYRYLNTQAPATGSPWYYYAQQ
jgi:hypothetical protein